MLPPVQHPVGWDFDQFPVPDAIALVADYAPDGSGSPAPALDFRFCHFYLPPNSYHLGAGLSEDCYWVLSGDSAVTWTLRDCALSGGRVELGWPDISVYGWEYEFADGAVTWANNLFENVGINLSPSFPDSATLGRSRRG